jgi:ABC-type lipoprotein release transport system permease subunit
MLLRLSARNVLRQRRRSLLTVLTMTGGFVLCAISIGWADGTYNDIIRMFTDSRTGQIQIHLQGYRDDPSIYDNISGYRDLGISLESIEGIRAWAPRIYSGGLVSVHDQSTAARLVGIDPSLEEEATAISGQLVEGDMLDADPSFQAVVGEGLADRLQAGIGDTVAVLSQGADGSIANDGYVVVGLIETGDMMSDRANMYMHIRDAQELLVLQGKAHEMVVMTTSMRGLDRIAERISQRLERTDLEVSTWKVFAADFYRAMKADMAGMWVMLLVIMVVVAVGVLNTVLMAVLERRREYGVLRALGTRPSGIVSMVVVETLILSIVAVAVGVPLGLLGIHILSETGIDLSQEVTYGGMSFREMRAAFTPRSLYLPAVTVLLTAMLVCLVPAVKAARTRPAEAMRTY